MNIKEQIKENYGIDIDTIQPFGNNLLPRQQVVGDVRFLPNVATCVGHVHNGHYHPTFSHSTLILVGKFLLTQTDGPSLENAESFIVSQYDLLHIPANRWHRFIALTYPAIFVCIYPADVPYCDSVDMPKEFINHGPTYRTEMYGVD